MHDFVSQEFGKDSAGLFLLGVFFMWLKLDVRH